MIRFGDCRIPARYWDRVTVTASGCWVWTGALANGYGKVAWREMGRTQQALLHRLVYERLVGPIPGGLQLDHLCRVRACCNPDHLEAVSQRENLLRGIGHPAVNAAKTHCSKGHAFTEPNTYQRKDRPGRICRTCHREQVARTKAAAR